MKPTTQAKKINERIQAIVDDRSQVIAHYKLIDESVQAEVRLRASWSIDCAVDRINYPKSLDGDWLNPLWVRMRELENEIREAAHISWGSDSMVAPINARTKTGPERRDDTRAQFEIEQGRAFLSAYRKATRKSALAKIHGLIGAIQVEQKDLLPKLRRANSEYFSARKVAKAEQAQKNAAALTSGRFWEATKDALKDYFHPPFDRNYLSDMSEKWRAALYTEMASTAWKAGKGDWRHKNIGTGRGYLCGLDDNGDEWGHAVNLRDYVDCDDYGDYGYAATVEDAMSELFGISVRDLSKCSRQGDVLFCATEIPGERMICRKCGYPYHANYAQEGRAYPCGCYADPDPQKIPAVELHPQDGPWEIMESHTVESPGLMRNGRYIRSDNKITITHTSHPSLILPPGDYRVYTLSIEDAD